ncbi:hypothetical protein [Succinimonas amylolytica]|uniref:hypothetical protein n=1 Tax=Succinimonas amylolytica TaxID=83769 RepID=UPI0003714A66|nr:hypothetical protein [Succinimonas amylolytica]
MNKPDCSVQELKNNTIRVLFFLFLMQISIWPVVFRLGTGSQEMAARAFYSGFLGGSAVLIPEIAYLSMASIEHRRFSASLVFAEALFGKLLMYVLFAMMVSICLKFIELSVVVFFCALVVEMITLFVAFVRKSCR